MTDRRGILILGGDADGNLGDRAILTAMCRAVQRIDPDAPVTVVSHDPKAMRRRLGVTALHRGWRSVPALCRAARRSRLVLIGGGGLFQDDDSLIKMPYWTARCLLMRACCPRVAGCSLGVGPLRSFSSRLSAMAAFSAMQAISVRDEPARQTARPLTARRVTVVPDPAFMLDPLDDEQAARCLTEHGVPLDDGPLIGVTVRRWFPPRPRWVPNIIAARFRDPRRQDERSRRLVELWARTLDRIVERTGGRVVMMPTYNLAHEGDDRLCRQVIEAMTGDRAHLVRIDAPALYKAVARRLTVMVGGRMHSTIFAASVGTPVAGLAYNPKFPGVFELLGLGDCVMSVERFVREADVEGFARLIATAMQRRAALDARSRELAARTESWLREVLA